MPLPDNLITGRSAKIPGVARGMDKLPELPRKNRRNTADQSSGFGRAWGLLCPGLEQPEAQYRFAAPERKWVADWAFVRSRVIVEIDGGQWVNGGHNRGSGRLRDMERDNWCALRGWIVLRYTPQQVRREAGRVTREVESVLMRHVP